MKAKNRWLIGIIFWVLAIVCLLFPLALFIYSKKDTYFAVDTSGDMFMGLLIALGVAVLVVTKALSNLDKNISFVLWLGIFWGFFYYMQMVLEDLPTILMRLIIGYIIFIPLYRVAKRQLEYHKAYKDERMRVEARTEAENATILRNINSIR